MTAITSARQRPLGTLAAALSLLFLAACQGAVAPTNPPATKPAPTPGVVALGTVTLTDTGCSWAGNPGSMAAGPVTLTVHNDTDDYAVFPVHRLRDAKSWADGEAAVALIQEALRDGTDWPEEVFQISDVLAEGSAEAGITSTVSFIARQGTYGVICAANTSSTGDVLTTFLVGPLTVQP